jgi:hypothetical protein
MAITYRTNDNTRWGVGQGSDLSAAQIDINYWELFSAITALQDHQDNAAAGIDFLNVSGDQFFVHLTDHTVLGPYQLPVAAWNFTGDWLPSHAYSVMDTFTGPDAGVYLVITAHTSGLTFDAGANDGIGHNFYAALLAPPISLMPAGGTIAQRLAKIDSADYNAQWVNDPVRIAVYVEGQPTSGEKLMVYTAVDTFVLPAGLSTSRASCQASGAGALSYGLTKNGSSIGSVNFAAASLVATFAFTGDVQFVPGDVLVITGPSSPSATQSNIAITLVGSING